MSATHNKCPGGEIGKHSGFKFRRLEIGLIGSSPTRGTTQILMETKNDNLDNFAKRGSLRYLALRELAEEPKPYEDLKKFVLSCTDSDSSAKCCIHLLKKHGLIEEVHRLTPAGVELLSQRGPIN